MYLMNVVMTSFLLLTWEILDWNTGASKICFGHATLDNGNNEYQQDPYWATYQMLQQFNDH